MRLHALGQCEQHPHGNNEYEYVPKNSDGQHLYPPFLLFRKLNQRLLISLCLYCSKTYAASEGVKALLMTPSDVGTPVNTPVGTATHWAKPSRHKSAWSVTTVAGLLAPIFAVSGALRWCRASVQDRPVAGSRATPQALVRFGITATRPQGGTICKPEMRRSNAAGRNLAERPAINAAIERHVGAFILTLEQNSSPSAHASVGARIVAVSCQPTHQGPA